MWTKTQERGDYSRGFNFKQKRAVFEGGAYSKGAIFQYNTNLNKSSVFQEIQSRRKLSLTVQAYLIKPVQRITKYQLLLKQLLDTCQKESSSGSEIKVNFLGREILGWIRFAEEKKGVTRNSPIFLQQFTVFRKAVFLVTNHLVTE